MNSDVKKEFFRMTHWIVISIMLYFSAYLLAEYNLLPQMQTVLWKAGHLNVAAFFGYRFDRSIFRDRINANSSDIIHLRRAIIIGCAMIAMALGM